MSFSHHIIVHPHNAARHHTNGNPPLHISALFDGATTYEYPNEYMIQFLPPPLLVGGFDFLIVSKDSDMWSGWRYSAKCFVAPPNVPDECAMKRGGCMTHSSSTNIRSYSFLTDFGYDSVTDSQVS